MFDNNPFREASILYKRAILEAKYPSLFDQMKSVMDPVYSKYDKGAAERESRRADIIKKRKHHEMLVQTGQLSQQDFDKLEKQGEFDITLGEEYEGIEEGKKFSSYEDCVEFYMDAKDYSKEDAQKECGQRSKDIQEGNGEYQGDLSMERLASMQAPEGYGDEEEYEEKASENEHAENARKKVANFLQKFKGNKSAQDMIKNIHTAEISTYEQDPNLSLVKLGDASFTVPHDSDNVKVVS